MERPKEDRSHVHSDQCLCAHAYLPAGASDEWLTAKMRYKHPDGDASKLSCGSRWFDRYDNAEHITSGTLGACFANGVVAKRALPPASVDVVVDMAIASSPKVEIKECPVASFCAVGPLPKAGE